VGLDAGFSRRLFFPGRGEDLKAAGWLLCDGFFHFIGILASFSMGFLSDRWGGRLCSWVCR